MNSGINNISSPFWSVVMVDFQSVFYLKMYQNNIFFIFLKSCLISTHQNDLKISKKILILKKNLIFF
jgi:hypothetical protein